MDTIKKEATMSNPVKNLAYFLPFLAKDSHHLDLYPELRDKVIRFALQNSDSLHYFARTIDSGFDTEKYTSTIKPTMGQELRVRFPWSMKHVETHNATYKLYLRHGILDEEALYEYGKQVEDLDDPNCGLDFPVQDGWELDHHTRRFRRPRFQLSDDPNKAVRDWLPVVEAEIKKAFPRDTITVEYPDSMYFGVCITIS